ncbi:hypothetical protein [Weissella koreensis]|uniref:hypothetical protein n=1 Tax=Weissella koreensis TaxID=165096 RepID=UPI001FADE044|nr:hypothetical protein [Weissella koreensis]
MANDFFKIDDSRKRKHLIDVLQVKKRRADISEEELLEAAGISSSKLERLGINLRKAKTEDEQVKVIDNEMTHGAVMGALKLIDQKGMKHVPAPAKIVRTRESIEAQRKAFEAKRAKSEQEAKELAAKSVFNVTTQPQIAMPSVNKWQERLKQKWQEILHKKKPIVKENLRLLHKLKMLISRLNYQIN